MLCPECKKAELTVSRKDIRYEEGGFPDVVLRETEVGHCPACHNEIVSIPKMTELHQLLAERTKTTVFRQVLNEAKDEGEHYMTVAYNNGKWTIVNEVVRL